MRPFVSFARSYTPRLLVMAIGCIVMTGSAQAATFLFTFSGYKTENYYYDPYEDPPITNYPLGKFTQTVKFSFPFPDPQYPGDPPVGIDYFKTDPSLGPQHVFFFPGYLYNSDGSYFTLGRRSFSYFSTDSEGSSYSLGVKSDQDLFPTIDLPTPLDIDIGPATGSTGTLDSRSGYYKEPQYGVLKGVVTHFRVTVLGAVPGAVPEPETWALMIVGFGAIGTALRRRRGRMPALTPAFRPARSA